MALSKIQNIAWASIAKVAGIDAANIAKVKGVEVPAGGGGAPAFRSASEAYSAATGNSLTITKPSGVIAGDILVVSIYWNDRSQAVEAPSGWTLIDYFENDDPSASAGSWFKVAGGAEPSDYTWSSPGSVSRRSGTMAAFSGSYDANPEDAAVVTTISDPGSAGITTVSDSTMVVYMGGYDEAADDIWTLDSGWTSAGPNDASACTVIAYKEMPTAGATGALGFSIPTWGSRSWSFVWAFKRND